MKKSLVKRQTSPFIFPKFWSGWLFFPNCLMGLPAPSQCFPFRKNRQLDKMPLGFTIWFHPNQTHCPLFCCWTDREVDKDGPVTLEREILCGNGQIKGWHLAAHEWTSGKREMGLGVFTGTHLKMEDRCIRLPETWKNKAQRLLR